jgi:hypothetical protein
MGTKYRKFGTDQTIKYQVYINQQRPLTSNSGKKKVTSNKDILTYRELDGPKEEAVLCKA